MPFTSKTNPKKSTSGTLKIQPRRAESSKLSSSPPACSEPPQTGLSRSAETIAVPSLCKEASLPPVGIDSHEGLEKARVTVLLPMPPSTNRLFYNRPGKGRSKTWPYRDWRRVAGWELKLQKPPAVAGPVFLDIRLPDRPGQAPDADNVAKALIDLLVLHRLIEGDERKFLRGFVVRWERDRSHVGLTIFNSAQ